MVIGVGVDIEQAGVERPGQLVDQLPVLAFGDVRDGEERHPRTYRPSSSTLRPPTSRVASSTTTSRWIGTVTVPPIPALAPNATWTVPRIFSSSSTWPVSCA